MRFEFHITCECGRKSKSMRVFNGGAFETTVVCRKCGRVRKINADPVRTALVPGSSNTVVDCAVHIINVQEERKE